MSRERRRTSARAAIRGRRSYLGIRLAREGDAVVLHAGRAPHVPEHEDGDVLSH